MSLRERIAYAIGPIVGIVLFLFFLGEVVAGRSCR